MMHEPKGRVIITVACYCNDEEVIEYAKQIESQAHSENLILLVTANKANDYKFLSDNLNALKIESHLYNAGKNLGYLNGCLFGIKQFSRVEEKDKIVISNTDITLEDNDIMYTILKDMADETIWCIAPSIQLKSGRYQNPFLRERPEANKVHSWLMFQSNAILLRLYTLASRIKNRNATKDNVPEDSGAIYAGHGSFFAINAQCLAELMNVSENIFMYGEELLVAEIIRTNNGVVEYDNQIHITHNENSTTGLANASVKASWYKQSFCYIYDTYFKEKMY